MSALRPQSFEGDQGRLADAQGFLVLFKKEAHQGCGGRIPLEQRASKNTCDTYAYSFQLLFTFASARLGIPPSDLQF